MGTIKSTIQVRVNVSGPTGRIVLPFVVDTGATLSSVPEDILTEIGTEKTGQVKVCLANGEREQRHTGIAGFEVVGLDGNVAESAVIFMPVGAQPLLGIGTLAAMGLWVDTENGVVVEENSILLCGDRKVKGTQNFVRFK